MSRFILFTVLALVVLPACTGHSAAPPPDGFHLQLVGDTIAPAPAAEPVTTPLGYVLTAVVGLLGTALTVALRFVGGALSTWTAGKAYDQLVSQLWLKVSTIVFHAEAELRPRIQKALSDGKLTPEEAAELKEQVLELVRNATADEARQLATRFSFGIPAIQMLLSGMVEDAVKKLAGAAATKTIVLPLPELRPVAPVLPVTQGERSNADDPNVG